MGFDVRDSVRFNPSGSQRLGDDGCLPRYTGGRITDLQSTIVIGGRAPDNGFDVIAVRKGVFYPL